MKPIFLISGRSIEVLIKKVELRLSFKIYHAFRSILILLVCSIFGCKKIIEIPPPVDTITSKEVFTDSANAQSAISGIYSQLINGPNGSGVGFANGAISLFCGASSDELRPFSSDNDFLGFSSNTLQSNNGVVNDYFWSQGFTNLYRINSVLEGLTNSKTMSISAKTRFTGECLFLRAYIDFYLTNIFGDIPLLLSSDYSKNALAKRSSIADVYNQIFSDLSMAILLLPGDFNLDAGDRVRANKWAASALIARAHLFNNEYSNALNESSSVISQGQIFQLSDSLNDIFLKNSKETILQLKIDSKLPTSFKNVTPEGYALIPANAGDPPYFYLSDVLLFSFEPGDLRRTHWIDSTNYQGTTYFYPYKYKMGPSQSFSNGSVTEYYMVLRLSEQYLIRAEAELKTGQNSLAISDINMIRRRAGVTELSDTLSNSQVFDALVHERQTELFSEWGHRWFDLRRWGVVNTLKDIPYKNGWQDYQSLYPIPESELSLDPNLTQNVGY